jgi:hypothetical protein
MTVGDRAAFRQKWASAELTRTVAKHRKVKEWQDVREDLGRYLSLPQLVVAEGGWELEENVRAATTYAARALELGGAPENPPGRLLRQGAADALGPRPGSGRAAAQRAGRSRAM